MEERKEGKEKAYIAGGHPKSMTSLLTCPLLLMKGGTDTRSDTNLPFLSLGELRKNGT